MPVVDLRVMKRSLTAARVPVESAILTVTAVRADGPFTLVDGRDVVFSFAMTTPFAEGVADEITLPATDGTFGYEWEIVAESQLLFQRLTDAPDVDRIDFGDLTPLERGSLAPTDENLDAWDAVATRVQGLRDETKTLRDQAWEAVNTPGRQGPSAFQVAQANGFTGTEVQWLASLEGDAGADAYQVAVANGFVGSQSAWLASLKGADGENPTPQSYADALTTPGPARTASQQIATATVAQLTVWAKSPDLLVVGNVTRDGNQAVTSADVVWPDGTPGAFTAETLSSAFPGAVDGYRITYGSPVTKTFTQPAITRNSAGAATTVPQIVVS